MQTVTGSERVSKGSFVMYCFVLDISKHSRTVDKLWVILVETISKFCIHVLGEGFKRLGLFTTSLNRVNELPSRDELLT